MLEAPATLRLARARIEALRPELVAQFQALGASELAVRPPDPTSHAGGPEMTEPFSTTLAFRVTGRVQGVSFRAWTRAQASIMGLSGWVQNQEDGSVIGLVHGPEEDVDRFVERLHGGPATADVATVQTEPTDESPPDGFVVLP
jgi:acylphosphatase